MIRMKEVQFWKALSCFWKVDAHMTACTGKKM
jgi:hypothetical protein